MKITIENVNTGMFKISQIDSTTSKITLGFDVIFLTKNESTDKYTVNPTKLNEYSNIQEILIRYGLKENQVVNIKKLKFNIW